MARKMTLSILTICIISMLCHHQTSSAPQAPQPQVEEILETAASEALPVPVPAPSKRACTTEAFSGMSALIPCKVHEDCCGDQVCVGAGIFRHCNMLAHAIING